MAARSISFRRKLIVVLLLAAGLVGAAMRQWYAPPSIAYEVGTLLMVLWVPAVGNIIGWAMRRWRVAQPRMPDFPPDTPFVAHVRATFALDRPLGGERCVLVMGNEAFTARCRAGEGASTVELQFLRPEAALPRLPAGTAFVLAEGSVAIGRGRVLERVA